jgi:hypothetical protein
VGDSFCLERSSGKSFSSLCISDDETKQNGPDKERIAAVDRQYLLHFCLALLKMNEYEWQTAKVGRDKILFKARAADRMYQDSIFSIN